MSWITDQFNKYRLFRRLVMVYCCTLVWAVTHWSFEYAGNSSLPGMELAAVITAIQAPITLLLGYFLKLYTGSADK